MQAAQKMEVYARRVLKTICRSAHLRLHSSLLTSLTDDLPIRTWATASSTLRVGSYTQLCCPSMRKQPECSERLGRQWHF